MKRSRKLYPLLSILFFSVLLLVNFVFETIYQKNIEIPYSLDDKSIMLEINNQKTHLNESDAFFDIICDANAVIAYDLNNRSILYYFESDQFRKAWFRESSPYKLLKEENSIVIFDDQIQLMDCPFVLPYEETDLIIPLDLKKTILGKYYIQINDENHINELRKILSEYECTYSIEPLKKDFLNIATELLYGKEGIVSLLVLIFSTCSLFTYTKLIVDNHSNIVLTHRVFGANLLDILKLFIKERIWIYLMCFILSIVLLVFGIPKLTSILSVIEYVMIDVLCVYKSLADSKNKMEVC